MTEAKGGALLIFSYGGESRRQEFQVTMTRFDHYFG